MTKIHQKIIIFFSIIFSVYCALTIGQSWDESGELLRGKIAIDYLLSLGKVDKNIGAREFYSPMYWSIQYFLTSIFPNKYQIQIVHLINLICSLITILGIGKISKELFNSQIGKITSILLFLFPIFFGHMGFNNKDTILALSHVWIFYLLIRYIKKQNIKEKSTKYFLNIGFLAALATGIQLVFLGSLIPVVIFILLEIFLFKRFVIKNFNFIKFLYDLIKSFFVFYLLLIIFWIDVHPNILTLPFSFLIGTTSENYWTGWPGTLLNGNYYLSIEVPKSYILLNLLYKTPEFILLLYIYFLFIFTKYRFYLNSNLKNFNYNLSIIIFILIFPHLILFLLPYPVYDGLRLFIWFIPYFCIIPAISIYYLINNFKILHTKIISICFLFSFIYFIFNFFMITPYQYTYLNLLSGKAESRYKKFENDYWASSINELVKKIEINKNEEIKLAGCGIIPELTKKYLNNEGYLNSNFTSFEEADYIIMTNRVMLEIKDDESISLINCFDKYHGTDIFKVERNNLILSTFRKIDKN
tara:strand:- start:432 stop:2015 length:1584 start_codon:yes stop_codon:yes gene_type:complete